MISLFSRSTARASCLALGVVLSLCACETDRWKHSPPPGKGSVIVDNLTSSGIDAYLDGSYADRVSRFDHETFDVDSGVYRVVLDESRGSRSWRGDVDVIEGKLTVLEVGANYGSEGYSVRVYFD